MSIVVEAIIWDYSNSTQDENYSKGESPLTLPFDDTSFCYPNPAQNTTQLFFETLETFTFTFTLIDELKNIVLSFQAISNIGNNKFNIALKKVLPGAYTYQIISHSTILFSGSLIVH